MKILHILYQSLPQISGSTIRSRDILMSQNEVGIDALAITVPFVDHMSDAEIELINNVKYYRTKFHKKSQGKITDEYKGLRNRLIKLFGIPKFIFQLHKVCKRENPDALHAHAMFFCGIAALIAGKINRKPVFYEVRSLWMLPKDNSYKSLTHKITTKLLIKIEVITMSMAKKVFVVNDNLKKQIELLGVHPEKLVVINNAVNTTLIKEYTDNPDFQETEGDMLRFGYVGSITPYEGIPMMLDAMNEVNKKGYDFKFNIYGSVREPNELKVILAKIKEHSLDKVVRYKGSIDPSNVYKAYQDIDVIVNPRLKNNITETVTPLKPIEAMAYKKLFIGSDVGGIKDLLKSHQHGFLFRANNIQSLQDTLIKVSRLSTEERKKLGEESNKFVMTERSWSKNARIYQQKYREFLKKTTT